MDLYVVVIGSSTLVALNNAPGRLTTLTICTKPSSGVSVASGSLTITLTTLVEVASLLVVMVFNVDVPLRSFATSTLASAKELCDIEEVETLLVASGHDVAVMVTILISVMVSTCVVPLFVTTAVFLF